MVAGTVAQDWSATASKGLFIQNMTANAAWRRWSKYNIRYPNIRYFAVFKIMISSKSVNQNMLKNSLFFWKILAKFAKLWRFRLQIPIDLQRLRALPPDPLAGRLFPHLLVLLQNVLSLSFFLMKVLKGKMLVKSFFLENTLYIWKYFVLNIWADYPRPQTVIFSYFYDSATSPSKTIFWRKLIKFGQVWLDLCEMKVKFGKIWGKIWEK